MLRGASAEARADLVERVAKTRPLADAATLGAQLFGIAHVLRTEVALRRVVTDAAIEAAAKVALATSVFGAKVEEQTMALTADAVSRRWTSTSDLPDVLEQLAVIALVESAGAKGDRISDELFAVRALVDSSPGLREALSDRTRSADDRAALLASLLGDQVLPATSQLVAQCVAGEHSIDVALEGYQRLAADARNETVATVHAARSLSAEDQSRLVMALGQQYATTVHLQVVIDPTLVGGLRIEIRDDVIDGTVLSRLDDARRQLAG